jgi:hypothetical protein
LGGEWIAPSGLLCCCVTLLGMVVIGDLDTGLGRVRRSIGAEGEDDWKVEGSSRFRCLGCDGGDFFPLREMTAPRRVKSAPGSPPVGA